jgi:hypothetical protein
MFASDYDDNSDRLGFIRAYVLPPCDSRCLNFDIRDGATLLASDGS